MTPKKRRRRLPRKGGAPTARLPLSPRTEARHGDATKFERARERERLRREIRSPDEER
jgi:hypothetical protein